MPTIASAAPVSARAEGRSPLTSASVNGTTALHATIGATMLIVPIERPQ